MLYAFFECIALKNCLSSWYNLHSEHHHYKLRKYIAARRHDTLKINF